MTSNVTYTRGFGGYSFSAAEIAQLKTVSQQLLDDMKNNPTQIGLGGAAYSTVLGMISDYVQIQHDPANPTTWTMELRPKAGVDTAVWSWVNGASKVNAASGFFAAFIREYTISQVTLRGIHTDLSAQDMTQIASNQIASRLLIDITTSETLPGALGVGAIDAGVAKAATNPPKYWVGGLFARLGALAHRTWLCLE
jgi:uncharacterized protein (DUF885 family)